MTVFNFEASGVLKMPTEEELKAADADSAVLAYSNGTLADGKPYWAYIAVIPSLYKRFYDLSAAKQSFKLSEYGTILKMGYTAKPPVEVVEEMQKKYGFDPDYKVKLAAEINKQQSEFGVKREENRIMDIVSMLKKKQGNK